MDNDGKEGRGVNAGRVCAGRTCDWGGLGNEGGWACATLNVVDVVAAALAGGLVGEAVGMFVSGWATDDTRGGRGVVSDGRSVLI